MLIQISSGQGPCECEIAVKGIFDSLAKEFAEFNINIEESHSCKFCGGFSSILFRCNDGIPVQEGTMEWKCKSPLRPQHKRKNWFVDISIINEGRLSFDSEKIIQECSIQFFHCGGNGGQNVNKVATGVRLTHKESGITVTATEERTQGANRRIAEKKIQEEFNRQKEMLKARKNSDAWIENKRIVRGNPSRIYEGPHFKSVYICKKQ